MQSKVFAAALALLGSAFWLSSAPDSPPITAKDIFLHLARTISWYQHLTGIDEGADSAENLVLRNNALDAAKRTMQTSFAFARAEAAMMSSSTTVPQDNVSATQDLQQSLNKAVAQVAHLEERLQSLDARIEKTSGASHDNLVAERGAIAADLALAKQMETTLRGMTSFGGAKASGSRGLREQINDLEAVNPIAPPSQNQSNQQKNDLSGAAAFHPETAGVFTLTAKAMAFSASRKQVDLVRDETDRLLQSLNALRDPLRASVRFIVTESDRISNDEDAATTRDEWLNTGKQLNALSAQFKQLSTVMAPLTESLMSLQSARSALEDWRTALDGEHNKTIRYLIIRISVVFGLMLLILLGSAIWQRAIFRYVVEPRRRRQLLLVKRVVVGLSLAVLFALGFFSGFGSMATLLGFATAGLALALQNVVLSAVAYFFLIGRYGLKVGDRVTVQGVTGQVIEVGLIRLFLMELAGTGTDLHPTGRLAVFANSVIFQPAALMKQAPGMDYAWHTATATVEDPPNYQQARERLTQAVKSVYEDYRQAIEHQHQMFERSTDMQTSVPVPVSRVQFTQTGLEITIRYPVSLGESGDIDERIVDGILSEAGNEPKLKFTPGGSPKIAQVV
jgi:small-conductance mechanosensitive channel